MRVGKRRKWLILQVTRTTFERLAQRLLDEPCARRHGAHAVEKQVQNRRRDAPLPKRGDVLKQLQSAPVRLACGAPPLAETWPNIGERFRAIGQSVSYRTFYARMSSQVHSDAEKTIRYLVARVGDDAMLAQRMAAETIWFSRLGLYFAAQCFLSASEDYCRCYCMKQAMTRLRAGQRIIEDELRSTATKVMVA